ncbi:MAG TPA: helix-turn-helix domain-containing protein [Solirubrobacterales bacterium]
MKGASSATRIREAALEGFAGDGVAATSVRDVAAAAGVSPGMVQHHFPTKAALREAVDERVLEIATESFRDFPEACSAFEIQKELGDRVTAIVRDEPNMLRYVARSISESEEAGLRLFDAFVAIATAQWRRLDEEGMLREGADLLWVALHTVVLNLATVMFEAAIDRHLPEPYRSPEMLERWNRASSALFQRGMYSEGTG